MELRYYQEEAVNAVYNYLREHNGNPAIVIPTGGGKSLVIGQICHDVIKRWNGRILVVAHRKELLEQNAEKIRLLDPEIANEVGIYSAGLKKRDTDTPIVVGGIQSIFKRACDLGRFDLILVDEAHRIKPEDEGMYRQLYAECKVVNPKVRLIGLTATPYRMTSGYIHGPENVINDICYEIGIKELISQGFLSKVKSKRGLTDSIANLDGVHVRGGEFIGKELEDAMNIDDVVHSACKEIVRYSEGRKKVLIFTCGLEHAANVCGCLSNILADSEQIRYVFGETPAVERDQIISDFRDGKFKYLVNVNVLTEGFDAPDIDLVALVRATKSPGLYYQMTGRALRTCPDKEDALILDFGENVLRHGPIDKIKPRISPSGNGASEEPVKQLVKECPECHEMVLISVMRCDCGYNFPPPEPNHGREADSENSVISGEVTQEWFEVTDVTYRAHTKKGMAHDPTYPKTLLVEYWVGLNEVYREWICVEHDEGSFAQKKAFVWWSDKTEQKFIPNASKSAGIAARIFRMPSEILIRKVEGEPWPDIRGYKYTTDKPGSDPELAYSIDQELIEEKSELIPDEEIPF